MDEEKSGELENKASEGKVQMIASNSVNTISESSSVQTSVDAH